MPKSSVDLGGNIIRPLRKLPTQIKPIGGHCITLVSNLPFRNIPTRLSLVAVMAQCLDLAHQGRART